MSVGDRKKEQMALSIKAGINNLHRTTFKCLGNDS